MVQSADVFMLKYGDGVISNFYFNEKMSFSCKWTALASFVGQQIFYRTTLTEMQRFFSVDLFLFLCSLFSGR